MDFHDMKRAELQKLCKQHNLPANLSNLDMADKLSSLFKVQEKEEVRPMRKTRSCLKNCDEMLSEKESDVINRKLKKVRFSPQNDVFQLGEKSERGSVVDNKGGVGRLTRCKAKLAKTIMISPVVKKRGKMVLPEVEKEDVENKAATSRVTRTRASLGKSAVISSPVVMKKKGQRALHESEKGECAVEHNLGASRVTRARALLGEKVLTSPVIIKKRGKKVVQEDEKEDLVVENKGAAIRVTRARAGKQVLISSPVVMKRRGKKAVQEDENEDLVVENKDAANRVTRARAGKQVLISSPVVMKKGGRKAVQEEKKSGSASSQVVNFADPAVEEEREVVTVKCLRSRKVENVASPKNLTRKRNTQDKSQGVNVEVSENKDAEAGITRTRLSKRNRMELTQVEPLEENLGATEKAGRRNITRSRNQFQAKASNVGRESKTRDVSEEAKEVVVQVKEPLRHSGRHVNTTNDIEMPIKSDEFTRSQTRHGAKRKSVMPQVKKAEMEKPVAGNLVKKNVDSPNESTKPIVIEKGSETGNIRRSIRNASGDGSISEDANGSGTDIKTGTTKKRKRDAVVEEVPSQLSGRRVNRKTDSVSDKIKEEKPVALESRTRSGNRQSYLEPTASKLSMSGNSRPSRTTGEKASPHHTRELSSVAKRSATGVEQSKTAAVTPGMRSSSGQKSSIHTAKKLRVSGNSGLHKAIGDKESPHQSREFSVVPRRSETELKARGSKSKQTPVSNEHPRRFTRSALKGKTDGPARVRGKIYQKKSQSVSKLPLSKVESSSPKVILASEGPLDIDVQSSYREVDRSPNSLDANASDLPEDKTACSTPQGGSEKPCSVDLNLQESEGPELINIHEVSPSDALKLKSDHAELELDISAREHAHFPGERPDSYDVHSSMPQIAGCSTDPIFDSSAILQDRATEANDTTPVHIKPAEGLDVTGDAVFTDRNSVDDGFSSLEQITSKGTEVNPQKIRYVEPSSEGITNVVLEGSTVRDEPSMNQLLFPKDGCSIIPLSQTGDVNEDNTSATQREDSCESNVASPHIVHLKEDDASRDAFPVDTIALADISHVDQSTSARDEGRPQLSRDVESISKGIDLNIVFQGHAINEDEPVYQSPLAEVAEITDNPVAANSDAACVTQQEGPTKIDANSSPLVHIESVENVDIIRDVGSPVCQSPLAEIAEITDNPVTTNSDAARVTQQEGPTKIDAKSPSLVHIELVDNVDTIGDAGSPVYKSPLAEVAETTDNPVTANRDAARVTEQEGPTEVDAKSPPLVHIESVDNVDIFGDAGSPVYQSTLAEVAEVTDNPVTANSDAAHVTQQEGPTEIDAKSPPLVHIESVCQSPLAEIAEITDNLVTANSDAARVTQQEGPTKIDAKSPSLVHIELVDNVDTIGDAGSPVYKSPLAEVAETTDNPVTANRDAAPEQEGPTEVDAKSPPLVHIESVDNVDIFGDAGSPVYQSTLAEVAEVTDNPVTANSDAARVTQQEGPTMIDAKSPPLVHIESVDNVDISGDADSPVYQSPLAEVAEITDNPLCANTDAARVTQQEGLTEIDAKNPPLVHIESVDNADIIGDAGSIDAGTGHDNLFNVEQLHSSAIKENQEASKNVNDIVADESTVNEENLTAEVGDCGPTGQEQDICNHSAEFAESGGLDKDSRSAYKELGEASSADLNNQTVSMIFSEEKYDMRHPEISEQADEPHKSMQEEFPAPNSIQTNEEVSILNNEFSKPEFFDTVMCSNKEFVDDSNQRKSTVESCLMREKSCTNKGVEFSTSDVVADSVAEGNYEPEPEDPSLLFRVTGVGNLGVEVKEELRPEDSSSYWSSDIFERATVYGSSLQKGQSSVISANVSEHNQSKDAKDESEISKISSVLDSSSQEMSYMPMSISSLPSNVTEVGHLLAEVKEQLPEDSLSVWSSEILPERAAEKSSSLHKDCSSVILADGSEHNQPECARDKSEIRERVDMLDSTTRESTDMPEYISGSQTSDHNNGGKLTENDLSTSSISLKEMVAFEIDTELTSKGQEHQSVGIEGREVEETVFEDIKENESGRTSSMYGDAHLEREWDLENISSERTQVISEDDTGRDGIARPVVVHKFPSSADDHCHTPSEDNCWKEQGTNMSMVKSSRNFSKEFFSGHDYCHRPLKDSCGKEQGTPMSMVKSSKNCGEDFSSQHENVVEHVKVCSSAALPQTICDDFAGFDNQVVIDLMGSTGRRISRMGALNNEKLEVTEPWVKNDKVVLEDGIELLKGNLSNCYGKDTIDFHRSEDTLQQFDMNDGETDGNVERVCQENDESPILVQMDADTNNVERSRDNLITIQGFNQEAEASGMLMKELPSYEDAMDSDALANVQYGGERVTSTEQTNETQGVCNEELQRIEDAMDANAPANLQCGHESVTLTRETNEDQECGPEDLLFFPDISGPENETKSDKMDGEELHLWYDDIMDKSEVAGKEEDILTTSQGKNR